MSDYIKRADLAAIISDLLVSPWAGRRMSDVALGIREALCLVQDIINDEVQNDALKLPAADVVKVVRCKDCRFFQTDGCRYDWPVQNVNDYCSKGERKEDET